MNKINLPGDKSLCHRALIFGVLQKKKVIIKNLSDSADVMSTYKVLLQLGANLKKLENKDILITPAQLKAPIENLDCGNSGTTMRLIIGLLAGLNIPAKVVGDQSLSKRPMDRVLDPLSKGGALFESHENNFAPIKITKGIQNGFQHHLKIASAQIKSALLLAQYSSGHKIELSGRLDSRDHTEKIINFLDKNKDSEIEFDIPGDISTATPFILKSILLREETLIENVLLNPTRIVQLQVLRDMGANISWEIKEDHWEEIGNIFIPKEQPEIFKPINIDEKMVPYLIDELPFLFLLATQANGVSKFQNLSELKYKESDRLSLSLSILTSVGASLTRENDSLSIKGPSVFTPFELDPHGDHRMTFLLALCDSLTLNQSKIYNPLSTAISDKKFWSRWNKTFQLGIIGDPVTHSLSPKVYDLFSSFFFLPINYEKWNIKESDLSFYLAALKNENIVGFNVTAPYKETLIKYLDHQNELVRESGAVNCIQVKNKQLYGFNTDYMAIKKLLAKYCFKNVLIIGAGGISKTTLSVLSKKNNLKIFIKNRTMDRTNNLIETFKNKNQTNQLLPFDDENTEYDLIINATPMGMSGNEALNLESFKFGKDGIFFDMVYNSLNLYPENINYISGFDMLLEQALENFKIWFQVDQVPSEFIVELKERKL